MSAMRDVMSALKEPAPHTQVRSVPRTSAVRSPKQSGHRSPDRNLLGHIRSTWQLYLFVIPLIAHVFVFKYLPIYGLRIAFTDGFSVRAGRSAPEWNNFAHFVRFLNSAYFWPILRNTLGIALYSLAAWPIPLVLALMMNQLRKRRFQKLVQMVTYAPYFISTVVVVSMLYVFLSPRFGVVNTVLKAMGSDPIYFMGDPKWGWSLYVFAEIWQSAGYGAIIYLAALTGVDVSTKEAAYCDGAHKLQIVLHIEIPWIMPTIIILFIMRIGRLLTLGFEKILLMQNSLNISTMEVVSTYVYKAGILEGQYDFAAAVSFMEAIINFILLISANRISKKLGQASLW